MIIKQFKEKAMKGVFLVAALASVAAVLMICIFLFANGCPAMGEIGVDKFLFGSSWKPTQGEFGIFPMIIGSIYVTALAVLMGAPIGIFCAIFMARFCSAGAYKIIKPAVNLLAGIPSIVYGFFALTVIVPMMQSIFGGSGKSLLTAAIILAIMILPTIINVSVSALKAVDPAYFAGSLALGATPERSAFKVELKAASSGVLAGVILGVARAVGEAMAVSMIAGNQPVMPEGLLSGVRTLTTNIILEMGYAEGLHKEALIATAVVLFVLVMIINLAFAAVKKRTV